MNPIIEISTIMANSMLADNIDTNRLRPCVIDAMMFDLMPEIGETLFNKISEDYANNTLSGLYLTLYNDYCVPILIHATVLHYIEMGQGILANAGNVTVQDTTTIEDKNKKIHEANKLSIMKNRLRRYLRNTSIPEYQYYYDQYCCDTYSSMGTNQAYSNCDRPTYNNFGKIF